MKPFVAILKTIVLSGIYSIFSLMVLFTIFNDKHEKFVIPLIVSVLLTGFTIGFHTVIIYTPLYYWKEEIFTNNSSEQNFKMFLPLIMLPGLLILLLAFCSEDIYTSLEFQITAPSCYLAILFSFKEFCRNVSQS